MNISIVVPVFNEEVRIKVVLENLMANFKDFICEIILIDDCSSDLTPNILNKFVSENPQFKVYKNERNLGHGSSVLRGLRIALEGGASHILTYDGDGFLSQLDIIQGINERYLYSENSIIEMIRTGRTDPMYRRFITFSLRLIVLFRTKKWVSDPNTPSRLVPRNILMEYLRVTSDFNPVPNLWFSIYSRLNNYRILQAFVAVEVEPKLSTRNSWGSKANIFPSRRFIKFCFAAMRFWHWKKS